MRLSQKLWRQRWLILFVLPGFIFFLVFAYAPMLGVIAAFQRFDPALGFIRSPFVGFDNFITVFTVPAFTRALRNTLMLSGLRVTVVFAFGIVFAILLYELRSVSFRRVIQTCAYLPFFISWVVASGLFFRLLALDGGIVNEILLALRLIDEPIFFWGEPDRFYGIATFTNIWKNAGFNAIIFLAALTNINPELYEASSIDGANRFRKIWHISLPGIKTVIVLMFILQIATLMHAGFDQMWAMGNIAIRERSEIIDTLILRNLRTAGVHSMGPGAAMGLFTSTASFTLFLLANGLARLTKQESLV